MEQFLEFLPNLGRGALTTLELTVGAGLVCVAISFILGIARTSQRRLIAWSANVYVEFFRGTSVLVQMFWIFFALPLFGIFIEPLTAGILALGLNTGAYGAEIVRGAVQAVPRDQIEAAIALNYTRWHAWIHVILPQAVPPMIPALANLLIGTFKESALLTAITVMELMGQTRTLANESYRYFEPMTMTGIIYLSISLPSALATKALERRLGTV